MSKKILIPIDEDALNSLPHRSQQQKIEEEKKQRLTKALRENLKKRKEQMRARLKLSSKKTSC